MEEKIVLKKESNELKEALNEYMRIILGCLLFALSVNLFVVPSGIYNGGVYGLAQIIRTVLMRYTPLNIPTSFDISGIINYIINIPLFYIAYRFISKQFFVRTIFCLTVQTVFLSVIPILPEQVFSETLLNVAAGGFVAGYGLGLMLRARGCSGGVDILGIYFLRNNIPLTVGKISIIVNAVIYSICAFLFNLDVACYSVIYAAIISYTMDKTHYQSINMLCFVITKNKELQHHLTTVLGRGVTYWNGKGAFLEEDMLVNVVVISKYEVKELKRVVNIIDPNAFVFMSEGITVDGYYLKKL